MMILGQVKPDRQLYVATSMFLESLFLETQIFVPFFLNFSFSKVPLIFQHSICCKLLEFSHDCYSRLLFQFELTSAIVQMLSTVIVIKKLMTFLAHKMILQQKSRARQWLALVIISELKSQSMVNYTKSDTEKHIIHCCHEIYTKFCFIFIITCIFGVICMLFLSSGVFMFERQLSLILFSRITRKKAPTVLQSKLICYQNLNARLRL